MTVNSHNASLSYIKSSLRYVLLSGTPFTESSTNSLITVNALLTLILTLHGTLIDGWDILQATLFLDLCRSSWMHGSYLLELDGNFLNEVRMVLTKNMRFPLAAGLIFLFRSIFLVKVDVKIEYWKNAFRWLHSMA